MRTQTRVWLILIVTMVGLGAYFLRGTYLIGRERALTRASSENEIVTFLNLYKLAEAGDTNKLQKDLRFLVYASSYYYDRNFSNDVVNNQSFLKSLAEARAIANSEQTQTVLFNQDAFIRQINEELHTNGKPENAPQPIPTGIGLTPLH